MNYRNILPLVSHTQEFSTDYWNDFGYWNDGTFWYEKTPTYTARVTAFAAATGITDYTILDPLNIFDLGLTYYGLDTIMKAIYPMVTDKTIQSDMATQMKYNFMNPLDTNAAFRLNWVGGWVYSRTGALPNGVNAYADTNFNPSINLTTSNGHVSFYSRNIAQGGYDIGVASTSNTSEVNIVARFTDDKFYSSYGNYSSLPNTTNTDGRGLYITNRNSTTTTVGYKNTSKVILTAQTGVLPNLNIFISGLNRNGIPNLGSYGSKQCAFSSIGNGLTDFQADIFSTLVNNLQKALNRAVY